MKNDSCISIVIRNRNESEHLCHVLKALQKQNHSNFEVILVDNKSTDDSVKIAKDFGAKILSIDEFTYGKALNLGIEHAKGEIIVILSAHSVPLGHYFLRECLEAFKDKKIGAARLVYAGKSVDMIRWLSPEFLNSPEQDFISKGPLASGCVIRRSVWEEVHFDEAVIAAEDKIWSAEILKRGYLIKTPIPAFYYYHKRITDIAEILKNYRELVAINQKFGFRIGFVKQRGFLIFTILIRNSLGFIKGTVKNIYFEFVRAYLRLRFPKI